MDTDKIHKFIENHVEPKGIIQILLRAFFTDFDWARRILGGKWELWVHDRGTLHTVLTWHWVKEWSDGIINKSDHIVAKKIYRKWQSLNELELTAAGGK